MQYFSVLIMNIIYTNILRVFMIFLLGLIPLPESYAGVSVVVNPSVKLDQLSVLQIKYIYLGKSSLLPNGAKIIPADQNKDSPTRKIFYKKIIKKYGNRLKSYWSKRRFTGKGSPPKYFGDDSAILKLIATENNYIGYIDSTLINNSVKVIFEIQ